MAKYDQLLCIEDAVGVSEVNFKATTTERMGFADRKEGITAHALVLVNVLLRNGDALSRLNTDPIAPLVFGLIKCHISTFNQILNAAINSSIVTGDPKTGADL